MIKKLLPLFLLTVIISIVFRVWFDIDPLVAGDWWYKTPATIRDFPILPYIWDTTFFNTLGGNISFVLPLQTYYNATLKLFIEGFHLPWIITERLVWFWPFLLIAGFSSRYLYKSVFPQSKYWVVATGIFLLNTYPLMLMGGGQVALGMAYALSPLAFAVFIILIKKYLEGAGNREVLLHAVVVGVVVSTQLMFDLRITYVTLVGVGLLGGISIIMQKEYLRSTIGRYLLFIFIIPAGVTVLLHAFWLLPFTLIRQNPLLQFGDFFTSEGAVKFFSFAKFEQAFSLLHPNWPENIFGKTYFLRVEFLFLPLFAYCALLFAQTHRVKKEAREVFFVLFFALLGLIGIFLSKGANEPFGEVYLWLFQTVPGFIMFRDPTKWYVLITVSYAILIPYTIHQITLLLRRSSISIVRPLLLFGIFSIFLFQLYPALSGQLNGTYTSRQLPEEYTALEEYVRSQSGFFRTLWIPGASRYAYYSDMHPSLDAIAFFRVGSLSAVLDVLKEESTRQLLYDASVRYVIIPADSDGDIFQKDRKYSESLYKQTVREISVLPYLTPIKTLSKIVILKTQSYRDHFSLENGHTLFAERISPVEYRIKAENDTITGKLIFSESFDPNWIAETDNGVVRSKLYHERFNSFDVENAASISIRYKPQQWVNLGLIISGISFIGVLGILFILRRKKYD